MIVGLTQIIASVSVILLLLFTFLVLTLKQENNSSNFLLSAFLFSNAMFIVGYLADSAQLTLNIYIPELTSIGFGFGYLFGPLLYFYTRSLTAHEFRFSLKTVWHFIPFIAYFLLYLSNTDISWQIKDIILNFQIIPYMLACFVLISSFRKEISHYLSSFDKFNLNWLIYVVGGFLLMWLIDLSAFIMIINDPSLVNTYRVFTFISLLINFIFAVLIIYKALQHPQLLASIIKEAKSQKYESSKLSDDEKANILRKIHDYFESDKPYLNPTVTIKDVSDETGIHIKYISQVINELLNKNFHDLVNSYRITEAKRRLSDKSESEHTILEILYESGFNSKTTFNTVFKKYTGITPTEFRDQNSNKMGPAT